MPRSAIHCSASTYPSMPSPAMTPSATPETYEWCRNSSRLWMLVMCTSTSGAVSIASASRSTTEVCDQPAGLSTTGSPSSAAACTQRSSSPSSSVCRTCTSRPSSSAAEATSSTSSAYVVVPYFSGSRFPSRPRLAPLSTWIVTGLPSGWWGGWSCGDGRPRGVEPGLVGAGEDARVADAVQDDEPQRGTAGLLVHPHDRLDALPVPGVAGGQPHRGDQPVVPVALLAGQQAGPAAELGGEQHADGDRLAVPPAEVLHPLDGVGQGVPVVEELAHAGVVEVLPHRVGLDPHRALDELLGVAAAGRVGLEQFEDGGVGDEAALDHL